MTLVDIAVFPLALAGLLASLCRLNLLRFRTHTPWIIVLHMAMGIACASAAGHAWMGESDLTEVAAVVAALAWVAVTYPTWREGVPPQFEIRPIPLDPAEWPHVSGGKGER